MRADGLHRRGHVWPYKTIAALAACLALALGSAPQRASASSRS
jgi:hypothetical protein